MRNRHAFTLVEVLTVVGIIGVLAAVILPVYARVRESAHRTSCINNLHQLGVAINVYMQDFDDTHPSGNAPTHLFRRPPPRPVPLASAWAGRIYPYIKTPGVFRCESDSMISTPYDPRVSSTAYTVSYGLNANFSRNASAAQVAAPSRIVLLFEVSGCSAHITAPDEETPKLNQEGDMISPVGDGVSGSILGYTSPWTGAGQGRFITYATGLIDNWEGPDAGDDYQGKPARHGDGANYLADDFHAKWLIGKRVSAGQTANASNNPQSSRGCGNFHGHWPCAEGTAYEKHELTFSTR